MRLIALVSLIAAVALSSAVPSPKANADWWKTAIFYQVYPRSFKDGDNSGEGDLQGIINKIDHFVEAGITAIWLSPIYKSPQVDSGYDISDFRDIDPIYGDLAKFNELIAIAHEKKLKVVMDFVPNHSSDQHEWFAKSVAREELFTDYYVWRDGTGPELKDPPNNWLSIWKGSAWEYHEGRGQFYLHQFSKQQPDLNYENPAVVTEMTETLKYWLDLGVDGFRIDAIPHLCETGMEDEPLNDPAVPAVEWNDLNHIYTKDQPATYEQIYKWRKFVDEYTAEKGGDTRVIMTEAYSTLEKTMQYYGTAANPGAHFSFNFQLITGVDMAAKATGIVSQINGWMAAMPTGAVPNWVIGNHDNHRVATRYGVGNADGMNMLVMMLPGVAVTYNGEEIGMEDGLVTLEQCKDPSVCPEGGPDPTEEEFLELGRDFERTPFHWDKSNANAGFNDGKETWLPVSAKYVTNNLADQSAEIASHFSIYKTMVETVRPEVNLYTDCTAKAHNEHVLIIRRTSDEAEYSTILVFNTGDKDGNVVDLQSYFDEIEEDGTVLVASGQSKHISGTSVGTKSVNVNAHESVIIKVRNGATAVQLSLVLLGLAALLKMFL